ncbi:MAG: hypothetical protein ACFCU5_14770 [Pleurocapsa sp.]
MKIDLLLFVVELDTTTIAGACLWSLALYLCLTSFKEWTVIQLIRWFDFAERSLYTSIEEYEETRTARESQNAFYASLFSIIPFLILGTVFNWLIDLSFGGGSWAIALGLMTCSICGLLALANNEQ